MAWTNTTRSWRRAGCLVACGVWIAPEAAAQSATARATAGSGYCHIGNFPKWRGEAGDQTWNRDVYTGSGKFEFRKRQEVESQLLVSTRVEAYGVVHSSETFCAISLEQGGACREISREAWDQAVPVLTDRTYARPALTMTENGVALMSDGRLYRKSGPKWVAVQRTPASPDGRYLAVFSYSGNYDVEHPLLDLQHWRWRDPVRGRYYIDIYNRETARLAVSIAGSFRGLGPNEILEDSFWLRPYYYVIPLSPHGKKRIMICNVAAADPANQPTPAKKK